MTIINSIRPEYLMDLVEELRAAEAAWDSARQDVSYMEEIDGNERIIERRARLATDVICTLMSGDETLTRTDLDGTIITISQDDILKAMYTRSSGDGFRDRLRKGRDWLGKLGEIMAATARDIAADARVPADKQGETLYSGMASCLAGQVLGYVPGMPGMRFGL